MEHDNLAAEVARLRRENAALRADAGKPLDAAPRDVPKLVKFTRSEIARYTSAARAMSIPLSTWIRAACERAAKG